MFADSCSCSRYSRSLSLIFVFQEAGATLRMPSLITSWVYSLYLQTVILATILSPYTVKILFTVNLDILCIIIILPRNFPRYAARFEQISKSVVRSFVRVGYYPTSSNSHDAGKRCKTVLLSGNTGGDYNRMKPTVKIPPARMEIVIISKLSLQNYGSYSHSFIILAIQGKVFTPPGLRG